MTVSVLTSGVDSETEAFLTYEGFMLVGSCISSPEELCGTIRNHRCEAALFGMQSPYGADCVRHFRDQGIGLPVISIMPGPRNEKWAHVCAHFLDCGGDDMIPGPSHPEEVAASMRALMRRSQLPQKEIVVFQKDGITLEVHVTDNRMFLNGRPLPLTAHEFEVLFFIACNPGPRSREEIQEKMYGVPWATHNSIEVFITRIRKKMGNARCLLKTTYKVGYEMLGRVQ